MEPKIAFIAALPEPEVQPQERTPPAPPAVSLPLKPRVDQAHLRLVIEQDPDSGIFIYKTVNRDTGEVVLQLPRDELLRLRDHADYQAGSVVDDEV